jgi:hypothetical protein
MITTVSRHEMEKIIRLEHPYWADEAIRAEACSLLDRLDESFEKLIVNYIKNGVEEDLGFDEFSINQIRSLRRCGYMQAIDLMDHYMKNPASGKAMILRRM